MQPQIPRIIRSFVRRERALGKSKQQLFTAFWPKYGLDLTDGVLVPEKVFGRNSVLNLEIGFGDGKHLFTLAKQYPEQDFVGIEIYKPGIAALFSMLQDQPLENLRVYHMDAVMVLAQCIPANTLDRVFILFPDPWPKKRHQKRRLIQVSFLTLLQQKLKSSGTLRIATDWENYAEHITNILVNNPSLNLTATNPTSQMLTLQRLSPTKYERRGLQRGHQVYEFLLNNNQI